MKQKRSVSVIGAVAVLVSVVVVMASCQQGNNPKNDVGTGLEVKPTGKAEPGLKGTQWHGVGVGAEISFAKDGNIANCRGPQALYTISGTMITFDLKDSIKIYKNITVEQLIAEAKAAELKRKGEVEEQIKKENDSEKKKELEKELEKVKQNLEALKNPSSEMKRDFEEEVAGIKKAATALEAYALFNGTFNSEKTELTIEKFPEYDWQTGTVKVSQIIFKKKN